MPNKTIKEDDETFKWGVLMTLLMDNQLIQFKVKTFKAVLDIREVRGNRDIRRMIMLAFIEAPLTEQLLAGIRTPFFLAYEVDVILTTGTESSIVFKELSLSLHM